MVAVALAGLALFLYFMLIAGVYWEEERALDQADPAHAPGHTPAHFPSA